MPGGPIDANEHPLLLTVDEAATPLCPITRWACWRARSGAPVECARGCLPPNEAARASDTLSSRLRFRIRSGSSLLPWRAGSTNSSAT